MISKTLCVIGVLLWAAWMLKAQALSVRSDTLVPAGTQLDCTIDEPGFSSQTAQRGFPVLCKITSAIEMYGQNVIPRGSYLSGNLGNYHDPGHFIGKGWIQLEFARLILPDGSIPMDAKVTSTDRYPVSSDGRILGRGHPVRDALEWAIPVLWPIKVLTLPARGPRPTLKGETRIQLRLMQDLMIPQSASSASAPFPPAPSVSKPASDDRGPGRLTPRSSSGVQPAISKTNESPITPVTSRGWPSASQTHYMLALWNGEVFMASDYWLDKKNLFFTAGGATHVVPLDALDLVTTRRLNTERGVLFTFAAKNR